jgi:preprotein translocase YajC subunit
MLFNLLATGQEPTNNWGTIIIIGVIVLAFVGFMIWQNHQNKKKAKEAEDAISKLQKGDKIKTIGGICGFLVEMNDEENTFVLETGTDECKSYIKFDKQAIYQTASMSEPPVEQPVPQEVVEEKPK